MAPTGEPHCPEPNRKSGNAQPEKKHWIDIATAVFALVAALGSIAAVVVGYWQWGVMNASNGIARENNRAFMSGEVPVSGEQSGPNGKYWVLKPQVTNGGSSSADKVSIVVGVMIMNPTELAKIGIRGIEPDPDTHEITISGSRYSVSSVPPHVTSVYGSFSISEEAAKNMVTKGDVMYVAGRINYETFGKPRWVKFCRRIYGDASTTENFALWGDRRIVPFVSGKLEIVSRPYGYNNCADKDCASSE